jgi:hypothetical protein
MTIEQAKAVFIATLKNEPDHEIINHVLEVLEACNVGASLLSREEYEKMLRDQLVGFATFPL